MTTLCDSVNSHFGTVSPPRTPSGLPGNTSDQKRTNAQDWLGMPTRFTAPPISTKR
ncbi:hypothetical protein BN2475_450117 [Paraburkholderia ribeironis]|uniref:Uncharacterized protein n=1 Tax=Paraburkholderia ribeironis TaxID=1247936 RepID=A0A1N7S8Y0_9BURK|nr:hypothetical protein BN2475_450117 [Paraburkholderia ribeironis]